MKCPVCQEEVFDNALFCQNCGAKIPEVSAPEAVSEPVLVEEAPVVEPEAVVEEVVQPAAEPVSTSVYEYDPLLEVQSVAQPEPVVVTEPVVVSEPEIAAEPEPEVVEEPALEEVPVEPVIVVDQSPEVVAEEIFTAIEETPVAAVQPEPKAEPVMPPAYQLPTHRSFAKLFWLGLLTFGIYPLVIWNRIPEELNMVASRYDGKRTGSYLWVMLLSVITLGLYPLVWINGLAGRIGNELERRKIDYRFGSADFWLWPVMFTLIGVLLALIMFAVSIYEQSKAVTIALIVACVIAVILPVIGIYIFIRKLCKAMNKVNADYNLKG